MLVILLVGGQHLLFSQAPSSYLINVESKGDSLVRILREIENKHYIKFYFDPAVKFNQIVSEFKLIDSPTDVVLNRLLESSGLAYLEFEPYLYVISDASRLNNNQFTEYFKRKKSIEEHVSETAIIIGRPDSINRSGVAHLKGTVIDGGTDSLVRNIKIQIAGFDTFTSDKKGHFEIIIPVGIHVLTIETDEFQTFQQPLKIYNDGFIDIRLSANAYALPEVVIGGSAQRRLENAVAGVAELTIKEIKRLPSLLGETDVLKALLTLPGVSNTGEVGSGYNVRGGNIDQNLILQEGAFHLNPSHVLGLFSAFNPITKKVAGIFSFSRIFKIFGV